MKCVQCGILGSDKNWKYCSVQCRNESVSKYKRNTHKRTFKICTKCGKSYTVKNSQSKRSKFCSNDCKYMRHRK